MQAVPYTLRELFFKNIAQTSPSPLGLEIQRAEGVFLYTTDNRKIIDLVSGVCVSNTGHGNKEIIESVERQLHLHMHLMVYGELIQSPQVEHAALLTSTLPDTFDSVYYVNSGSEANEAAMKLAKRVTGRREMISFYGSYHGSTHGALSMMGNEEFKNSFRPLLPGVSHIRFNSFDDLSLITESCACVIAEPVMAEAGVLSPQNGYLKALRERCTETGTLLIFDEIQTGFGRTGTMFSLQKYEVVPDILTLAKALGGGMPLGAIVASQDLMRAFQSSPVLGHITTFGGHPVSCSAALASLKLLLREDWVARVNEKSAIFVEKLREHKLVKEIRAEGLLIAVDLKDENLAQKIMPILIEEGVLSDWFLFCPTAFRIAPPLTINYEEIIYSIERILRALDRLQ
ncbi:MAG: aspartate aminotransferase family protein [Bacteroidales bacterium]|jgi:acetylornithine/succinyldiaminopimelate/putrescine aminotransferase|nr:aspartate aminotransferase family protein [Bacteroidales bacterium]